MPDNPMLPVSGTGVKAGGAAKAVKKSEANTPVKKSVREYKKLVAETDLAEQVAAIALGSGNDEQVVQTVFVEVGSYDDEADGAWVGDADREFLIPWDELEDVVNDLQAELDNYHAYLDLKETAEEEELEDARSDSADDPVRDHPASGDHDGDRVPSGEASASEGGER